MRWHVSFQLCSDVAHVVTIEHDDIGLKCRGVRNRGQRSRCADVESVGGQVPDVRAAGRGVNHEQHDWFRSLRRVHDDLTILCSALPFAPLVSLAVCRVVGSRPALYVPRRHRPACIDEDSGVGV
jgi:hypothetical protein